MNKTKAHSGINMNTLKLSQQDAELLIQQLSKPVKIHKKLQQAAQRYAHKIHATRHKPRKGQHP